MGKKHSKNAETRGWYSAAEKKRDTAQSSWGTQAMRLSADSVVDWDCCCLSTARPSDPVITPEGFLYNRESLLEYMLAARHASARKLKEWEDQMDSIMKKGQTDAEQEQRKLVQVCCLTHQASRISPHQHSSLTDLA
jgi:nitric oxide synthase-interacting protein